MLSMLTQPTGPKSISSILPSKWREKMLKKWHFESALRKLLSRRSCQQTRYARPWRIAHIKALHYPGTKVSLIQIKKNSPLQLLSKQEGQMLSCTLLDVTKSWYHQWYIAQLSYSKLFLVIKWIFWKVVANWNQMLMPQNSTRMSQILFWSYQMMHQQLIFDSNQRLNTMVTGFESVKRDWSRTISQFNYTHEWYVHECFFCQVSMYVQYVYTFTWL